MFFGRRNPGRCNSAWEEDESEIQNRENGDTVRGGGGHRRGCQAFRGEKYLSECRAGDTVYVQRLVGKGPVRRRLREMGLNPGTTVRVVKYAPLKDPIQCEIKGYQLALRVAEAGHIIVTVQKT